MIWRRLVRLVVVCACFCGLSGVRPSASDNEPAAAHRASVVIGATAWQAVVPLSHRGLDAEHTAEVDARGNESRHSAIVRHSAELNGTDENGAATGIGQRFQEAIKRRDLKTMQQLLDRSQVGSVDNISLHSPFDIASSFIPIKIIEAHREQVTTPQPVSEEAPVKKGKSISMLAAVAADGWLPGLSALLDWSSENQPVGVDSDGTGATPLLHAVRAGHAKAAQMLLEHGASPFAGDKRTGETPLEAAARTGRTELLQVLLMPGSELEYGLAPLRLRLRSDAARLPNIVERWPIGPLTEDGMDKMRSHVPEFLQPSEEDRAVIGDLPYDWVTLYQTRILWALADGTRYTRPRNASFSAADVITMSEILADNQYDMLLRSFSWVVIALGLLLGTAVLLAFIVFRLRVYGSLDVPVSLAHMIPGAFDPARLTDPDFDPRRQKVKLPYRNVRDQMGPWTYANIGRHGPRAFVGAFLGIFCSWFLQFVRIPPENDIYDEDYASDDDETSRRGVRQKAMWRAKFIRNCEVIFRTAVVACALCWLLIRAQRWELFLGCLAVYVLYALTATIMAVSTVPVPVPEMTPDEDLPAVDEAEGGMDAARMVNALFTVQYGKRWGRAVATTRSTASMSRSKVEKRKQRKKRTERGDRDRSATDNDDALSDTERNRGADRQHESGVHAAIYSGMADAPYSDSFQRSFLQAGVMHIEHKEYLVRSAFSLAAIFLVLLYVLHLAPTLGLIRRTRLQVYCRLSPVELFRAYGAVDSGTRMVAVFLELLLLGLITERLHAVVDLLNVSALSLMQRRRALAYAMANPPPKGKMDSNVRLREAALCVEFAAELSSLRWSLLCCSTTWTFAVFLKTLVTLILISVAEQWRRNMWVVDFARSWINPWAALYLCLIFFWPLLSILVEGARCNQDVHEYGGQLLTDDGSVSHDGDTDFGAQSSNGSISSTEVTEMTKQCVVSWPSGRQLGFAEPGLLVFLTAAAFVGVTYNEYYVIATRDGSC